MKLLSDSADQNYVQFVDVILLLIFKKWTHFKIKGGIANIVVDSNDIMLKISSCIRHLQFCGSCTFNSPFLYIAA